MNPGGAGVLLALGVAALVGGGVSGLWIRTLSRWLPFRALAFHLAAGPFMVVGTVPVWVALTGWMGSASGGESPGTPWDLLLMAAVGGMFWLAGLRCLLEGHRVLRSATGEDGPPA